MPDGTRVAFRQGDGRGESDNALHASTEQGRERITRLLKAGALPNEARLVQDGDGWKGYGDTVDIALLAAAHEAGMALEEATQAYPLLTRIPYESDLKFAASFHQGKTCTRVFVKGAPETLFAMFDRMNAGGSAFAIDREALVRQKEEMAARGLRVLAFAEGEIASEPESQYGHHHLVDLAFLGFAGMQDPVRPEVPDAIRDCYAAGIEVVMVTGDDPGTASAIARDAGLQFSPDQMVTGQDIRRAEAEGADALDRLTGQARIYARVDPAQRLSIVLSLARNGHFVALTGDGVNDAPALKHAHVGVAMGRKGTDVAKESADIILTDDNFASIVAGVREGRVAYANIRKVVFMLVSTGAAEVVLFLLAFPLGLPMPLLPVQLLWLNLVTNGIQDVALAAEKAEGDELSYPPRSPNESLFDRVMIRRIWHSTLVMDWAVSRCFTGCSSRATERPRHAICSFFCSFSWRISRPSTAGQSIIQCSASGSSPTRSWCVGTIHVSPQRRFERSDSALLTGIKARVAPLCECARDHRACPGQGAIRGGENASQGLMSTRCVTVSAENSIKRAAQIMVDHDLSGLPVLGDDGQLVGIITEGDLLRRCELGNVEKAGEELPPETRAQGYLHSHGWKVGHVMSRSVVAVKEDAPDNRIAELMLRHRIKRVPVLRGDRVVGIVSRRDLLQLICSAPADATAPGDAAMARSIRARLHQDLGLGDDQIEVKVKAGAVRLRGLVGSEAERQAMAAVAEGVRGVAGIVLDVAIAPGTDHRS